MSIFNLLFNKKIFSFTPVPDDWPPEGSMQFMCRKPADHEDLPTNFLHYEFGPNWNESDPVAIDLGLKILTALCRDRVVLTDIKSTQTHVKKRKTTPKTFSEHYFHCLQEIKPDIPAHLESTQRLAYLTVGLDARLLPETERYYSLFRPGGQVFVDFYVLPQENQSMDVQAALTGAASFQYDMKLEYIEYGPTSLEITLNTDTVDIATLQSVVETVCQENDVLLLNPNE